MPLTVNHARSLTNSSGSNSLQIQPQDWNNSHSYVMGLDSSEIIRAIQAGNSSVSTGNVSLSNANGLSFGMDSAGNVTGTLTTATHSLQAPLSFSSNSVVNLNRTTTGSVLSYALVPFLITSPVAISVGILLRITNSCGAPTILAGYGTLAAMLYSENGTNLVSMSSKSGFTFWGGMSQTRYTTSGVSSTEFIWVNDYVGLGGFSSTTSPNSSVSCSRDCLLLPGSMTLAPGSYWVGVEYSQDNSFGTAGHLSINAFSFPSPTTLLGSGTASSSNPCLGFSHTGHLPASIALSSVTMGYPLVVPAPYLL